MWDILQVKDDDPEKRIRELERGLADVTRPPRNAPRYTGNAPYVGDPTWGVGFRPPRRKSRLPWVVALVALGFLVPTIVGFVAIFETSNAGRSTVEAPVSSTDPSAVPQGGELRVGGNSETKTVACNDGKLTLDGHGTDYSITGHCATLTVDGYNNKVVVDSADILESTGYSNTVRVFACNNGKLKLSADAINFKVTGHCASVAISSFSDNVTVDSVDSINVSGDWNVVTYHSGAPKITDSGHSNKIQQG
ncbi:MAG: hypothetical protein QOD10_1993 [Mycobacterium sp.]|jgi:hypothetical protein|nr:hypothetical protein [Mycobacterium sp.]